MKPFGWAMLATPLLACAVGCADTHSIPPPVRPNAGAAVDIGPITDQSGVDVGPVLAERMRERKLAAARYVSAPGENPYFSGSVRVEHGDESFAAANPAGWTFLTIGICGVTSGAILYGLVRGERHADSLKSTSLGILGLGAVVLAGGIALLVQPSRVREGKLIADLEVRRGGTAAALKATDRAAIHHDYKKDEQAGGPLLDGVANAIAKEASK